MKIAKVLVLVLVVVIYSNRSLSQDRYFARTYNSNVLSAGSIDLEFWHTSRFGHLDQYYNAQDQRVELEFGLGGNLQTAFYFNRYQTRASDGANGTATSSEIGFSNEWKWQFKKPVGSQTGMALYGEWGLKGGDELEFETKFIADKTIGKNLFAFNALAEYEKEFNWINNRTNSKGWSSPVEFDLAYMRNINYNWGLGFEIRNHNAITSSNSWEHSVLFGGPTINYRGNGFFVIANYQPQWVNLRKTDAAPNSKVLDELERAEARILVGITIK